MRAAFALPRTALALVLAMAIFACVDGDSPTGNGGAATGGGNGAAGLLVGQWSHTEVFEDDNGDVHSSRTVWRFDEDSSAERMVIATSVAAGITDTVTASARWEATASKLTVTFQPPDSGTVSFNYQVHLSTLTLGGVQFLREE
jgi:hypothetical protein